MYYQGFYILLCTRNPVKKKYDLHHLLFTTNSVKVHINPTQVFGYLGAVRCSTLLNHFLGVSDCNKMPSKFLKS